MTGSFFFTFFAFCSIVVRLQSGIYHDKLAIRSFGQTHNGFVRFAFYSVFVVHLFLCIRGFCFKFFFLVRSAIEPTNRCHLAPLSAMSLAATAAFSNAIIIRRWIRLCCFVYVLTWSTVRTNWNDRTTKQHHTTFHRTLSLDWRDVTSTRTKASASGASCTARAAPSARSSSSCSVATRTSRCRARCAWRTPCLVQRSPNLDKLY